MTKTITKAFNYESRQQKGTPFC